MIVLPPAFTPVPEESHADAERRHPLPFQSRRLPHARGSSQSLESANGGAFGNWKPTSYARRIAPNAVS
jgi:hypothetical protein